MSLARIFLVLLLALPFHAHAKPEGQALERYFFTGVLDDKYQIQMELRRNPEDGDWQGSYFYQNPNTTGDPIQLSGMVDDEGGFQLSEFVEKDEKRNITGHFSGRFDADRAGASGTWNSADGKRRLPFRLKRVAGYQQRTAERDFRFPLEGGEEETCPCYEPVTSEEKACVCRAQ